MRGLLALPSKLLPSAVQSRWLRAALGFVVLAFCAAPVPGDVGGCNQRAEELDPGAFLSAKASVDCQQCQSCSLVSETCERACEGVPTGGLPEGCIPLVHDGEVCLRALGSASCEDYGAYVRDDAPTTPTECNFCPRSDR